MTKFVRFAPVLAISLISAAAMLNAAPALIQGDYLETRSADVYTGSCIANSEVNLSGDQAILAWKIDKGSWDGVTLDGLGVVGVAKASATLGDPFRNPYPAKAVLIVDQRATPEQQVALQSFAKAMAKDLLANVVRVEKTSIQMELGQGEQHGNAKMTAGALAAIETRSLHGKDHLCGNEDVYYQPLTELQHAMPVFTLDDEFRGKGLDVTWKINGKRSAFLGHFSQASPISTISMK